MGVARVETKKEINVLDSEFKSPLAVQTSIAANGGTNGYMSVSLEGQIGDEGGSRRTGS